MGTVVRLSQRPAPLIDVFKPVNYRSTGRCKILVFSPTDDNRYAETFDAQGVQYAEGERLPEGFHVIRTPDSTGPLLRYISRGDDGTINVYRTKGSAEHWTYLETEVRVMGLVFQFIRDFKTGERWELIRGPAHGGDGEEIAVLPIYDVSR